MLQSHLPFRAFAGDPASAASFLAKEGVTPLRLLRSGHAPEGLAAVWLALADHDYEGARAVLRRALTGTAAENVAAGKAPLYLAQALADLSTGRLLAAEHAARLSLDAAPDQWAALRVLVEALAARRQFATAYDLLMTHAPKHPLPAWDEPFLAREFDLAAAALAWSLKRWDVVAAHLDLAFPEGIASMPYGLKEDVFRLSFYRERPADAAAAAALLIQSRSEESTDALIQAIVQQGWTAQALPLYRSAFTEAPRSPLLRRRLVALCLKEGAVEEARVLTRQSALEMPSSRTRRG